MKNNIFRWIYTAGVLLVFTGIIFRFQHWENGSVIFLAGIIIAPLGYELELWRLRKRIKELEENQK